MALVASGCDVLVHEQFARLRGQRIGLIANQSAVDHQMRHLADLLNAANKVRLTSIFAPEHGLRGDAQDMICIAGEVDRRTGAPVHSLYGSTAESLTPTSNQLDGLDVLVFDVQDVGSRYYTFAATMLYAMKSAARAGLRFLVLDRPNPIGGVLIEGPAIAPEYHSFVGAYNVPIRHGMTVGELAHLYLSELRLNLDLEVVACRGWEREMLWPETGGSWAMPSPNMPTPDTALVYPGGCLIEGTNLSEGRGTTRPFELWGAPWLDSDAIFQDITPIEGAWLRPCAFRPMFHKHAGTVCFGLQPHVTDPARFRPVTLYLKLLASARAQDPERFRWRTEPYEFVRDPIAIDLLFGSSAERLALESGIAPAAIAESWSAVEEEFRQRRAPHLLYD
jgi:uncharacterized protein YbbC (DUF1343 family)